jgi:hypothetical protein
MRGRQKSQRSKKSTGARSHQPVAHEASREVAEGQRPTAETVRQAQRAPESLGPAELLQLQRIVGNRAVNRALSQRQRIQPSLAQPQEPQQATEPTQEAQPDVEEAQSPAPARRRGRNGRPAPAGVLAPQRETGPVQRGLWDRIRKGVASTVDLVRTAASNALGKLRGGASGALKTIQKGATAVRNRINTEVQKVRGWVAERRNAIAERVSSVWKQIRPGATKGVEWLRGQWNRLVGLRNNLAKTLKGRLRQGIDRVRGLWKNVTSRAGNLWNQAKNIARTGRGWVEQAWAKIRGRATSLWSRVQAGARRLGDRIRGAVREGLNRVRGLWARSGAKALWDRFRSGLQVVWNGIKWVEPRLWAKLRAIRTRAQGWWQQLPTRLARLHRHLWEGVRSLRPQSLRWWRSLGNVSTWKGYLSWLGTSLVYLLEAAGAGEIYETITDFVKFNTRPLSSHEKALARMVFGGSIPYDRVRVDERAVIGPGFTGRAYVSFHIINGWRAIRDETLIHEMTRVWQYGQMGAIYMPRAIGAQVSAEGYDYGGLEGLNRHRAAGQGLTSFNVEQQAMIVQHYYTAKHENRIGRQPVTAADRAAILAAYEHFAGEVRA